MNRVMRLEELLAGLASGHGVPDVAVTGLQLDSRKVRAGDAFVALAGSTTHGMAHAAEAFARGAVVALAESGEAAGDIDVAGPIVHIPDLRARLGAIAARFHGEPSKAMHVVGVTGTNGKTSIVNLLAAAWNLLGHRGASIGTLGTGFPGHLVAGERTTPDVISVHAELAALRDAGATHVAMEVSSHALDQHRVDDVAFDVAVFTNLTRDHLDYHHTMEAYGEAKARLFAWPTLEAAVINVDDAFGRLLVERLARDVTRWRTSTHQRAEVSASVIEAGSHGLSFDFDGGSCHARIESRLLGRFNVANLLAVAACLLAAGEEAGSLSGVLRQLQPVPGRMSRLGGHDGKPLVVVDYSHTPDALEQALTTLRDHCEGRLTCVFGCGGERDAGKRPLMAAVAERLADRVVVTDDNPRAEDGDAIVAGIMAGFHRPAAATVERDRAKAIALALAGAGVGDVVLVAGKGHEAYQEINGTRRPFNDLDVARVMLEGRAC